MARSLPATADPITPQGIEELLQSANALLQDACMASVGDTMALHEMRMDPSILTRWVTSRRRTPEAVHQRAVARANRVSEERVMIKLASGPIVVEAEVETQEQPVRPTYEQVRRNA